MILKLHDTYSLSLVRRKGESNQGEMTDDNLFIANIPMTTLSISV